MSEISLRKLSYVFIEFCHFNYSKDKLILDLMKENYDLDIQDVQSLWNFLEHKLAKIADKVIPLDVNVQQSFNSRMQCVNMVVKSILKIGKNLIAFRLTLVNKEIKYDWLNISFVSYRLKIKKISVMKRR